MYGSSLLSSSVSCFGSGGFTTIFGFGISFYSGATYVFGSSIVNPTFGDAHTRSGAFFPPDSFIYSGISKLNFYEALMYLLTIQTVEIMTYSKHKIFIVNLLFLNNSQIVPSL